jgi:cytochrome d ubiquinol oxidase subunit I
MIACGLLMFLLGAYGWWRARKGTLEASSRYLKWAVPAAALPFVASLTGWTFTEMGRQPWAVFGLLKTKDAGSPSVSTAEVVITLVGFTLLYGVLAAIAGRIFVQSARKGPGDEGTAEEPGQELALAY